MDLLKTRPYFLLWLLAAHLGLWNSPLRFPAAVFLIGFLPGYVIQERFSLWKDPLFAAVGSVGLSFLLTPLLVLPVAFLLGKVHEAVIIFSLDIFFLMMMWGKAVKKRIEYNEKNHSPLLPFLLLIILSGIFAYMDLTGLGPYSEDWIYLFGILKELSRNMPPQDPEASFLLMKYPWVSYFYSALLHRLGGVSAWKVLEFVPVLFGFVFLGLVYMIIVQATGKKGAGIWAIVFMTIGRESEWVIRSLQGWGWDPFFSFDPGWAELQTFSVYSLLWGWYLPPNLIGPLFALYFFIRYDQRGMAKDLWFSWGACALSCFFHPAYYLGFMIGYFLWIGLQMLRKRFRLAWLLFYAAFLPYFLTFFLFLQPQIPSDPLYLFWGDLKNIGISLRNYLGHNGVALPLALAALVVSREARTWLLPFAAPLFLLSVLGVSKVNHLSHVLFPGMVYLSLLAGIGAEALSCLRRPIRYLTYAVILGIILPPFGFHLSERIRLGWTGALDQEQKIAGTFIRTHTAEDSTFLILPDSRYSAACVEGLGERRLVFGWVFHLNRYESMDGLNRVIGEILNFLSYGDEQSINQFLRKYKVTHIFLGPDEIRFIKDRGKDPGQFRRYYPSIYRTPQIEILKVDKGRRP
jgi:hypothetical protein